MNIVYKIFFLLLVCAADRVVAQPALAITNTSGLQLIVADMQFPLLKVILPGEPVSDRGIEIEFPEHVTGLVESTNTVRHLYLVSRGNTNVRTLPAWHQEGNALVYETQLEGNIQMTATARLDSDGVHYNYRFANHSAISYANLQAVTCVKLYSVFSDTLLERTYVHHSDGFELVASETPQRLEMPLTKWLPCRYLVSYTWPVHSPLIEKGADSITRYYKSRKADMPLIATLSHDKKWTAATYTKETGNLWTNPERSCQHADPYLMLPAGGSGNIELKTYIIKGQLDRLLGIVKKA